MIKVNNIVLKPTIFPDGTSQVWHLPEILLYARSLQVSWHFESEAEIMHLAQLKTLLGDAIDLLYIEYLPYARQDKDIGNHTCFALHTFAALLNAMNFKKIHILDVHSEVALRLIKNSGNVMGFAPIYNALYETRANIICYGDESAFIKYTPAINCRAKSRYRELFAQKIRNPATGAIESLELRIMVTPDCFSSDNESINVMIIDDICDGGATFIKIAQQLYKDPQVKEINLYVTHGIFSKGPEVLFEAGIKRIFTFKGEVHAPHSAH